MRAFGSNFGRDRVFGASDGEAKSETYQLVGWVTEWFKAPVLKTGVSHPAASHSFPVQA